MKVALPLIPSKLYLTSPTSTKLIKNAVHIFKNPTVAGANAGAFFTGFVFYCNLYYVSLPGLTVNSKFMTPSNTPHQLPQFYQVVRLASPIKSGVLIIPLILTQTITSFTSGFIVSKTGNYTIQLYLGFFIWTIACGLLSTISPQTSDARLIGYQIMSGFGSGQTFQTNLIAIQAAVKRSEMAVATGTRNFVRLLGGTVALAACAAILNNTVKYVFLSLCSLCRQVLESGEWLLIGGVV